MIAAIPFWELRMVTEGVRVVFGGTNFVIPTFGIPVDPGPKRPAKDEKQQG